MQCQSTIRIPIEDSMSKKFDRDRKFGKAFATAAIKRSKELRLTSLTAVIRTD
jgi:hypothetical protein